jgi:hypothetical protein
MKKLLYIILAAVFVLACSSEDPAIKQMKERAKAEKAKPAAMQAKPAKKKTIPAGVYSLTITPSEPVIKTRLGLLAKGFKLQDARVVWKLNGFPVSTIDPLSFDTSSTDVRKGDEVLAEAMVGGSMVMSEPIRIRNSIPELTRVKLMPEVFKPGEKVRIEAESTDDDGDIVIIQYEWIRNNVPAGTDSSIDSSLQRGDKFSVKVTPYDGEDYGETFDQNWELGNLPPMFAQPGGYTFEKDLYTFQASATDADGDTLTYKLKSGPKGMTVDSATGLVKWTVPPDLLGTTSYTLTAEDGSGGMAEMTYKFTLSSGKEKKGEEKK